PNFALAGSQDHGTTRWGGTNAWPLIFGGDGACCAVSSNRPDQYWALSTQNLEIYRTRAGGSDLVRADAGIDKTGAPFIARLVKSPVNDDIMLGGTDNLWKCTNFFSAATPAWYANGPEMGAGISALAFAPSDSSSSTYAFATSKGQAQLTATGGA